MEKEKEPQYCVNCKHHINTIRYVNYCKINSVKDYIHKKDNYYTCNTIRGNFHNPYCKYYEPKQSWFKRLFKKLF